MELNKQGLPVTGSDVEFFCDSDDSPRWHRCEMLYSGSAGVVCRFSADGLEIGYSPLELKGVKFRAYKTPEQLAAEEHTAKLGQLMHDAGITDSAFAEDPEALVWAEALLAAGWVKP